MRTLLATLLVAGLTHAQTIAVTADTPTLLTAVAGPSSQSTQIPAGPLSPRLTSTATTASASSIAATRVSWDASATPTGFRFDFGLFLTAAGPGPVQASAVSGGFLFDLSVPTSGPAWVTIDREVAATAGAPAPRLRVDIDNNGSTEFDEMSADSGIFALGLGPTPLSIRVDLDGGLTGTGQIAASLVLTVTPATGTTVSQIASGCTFYPYAVEPTFDGGLQISVDPFGTTEFGVAVFGLSWQPVVLSTSTMPCLLLPAQDVFVYLPPNAPRHVDIPPFLRPIVFDTQAVIVGSLLTTTNAYRVIAQ